MEVPLWFSIDEDIPLMRTVKTSWFDSSPRMKSAPSVPSIRDIIVCLARTWPFFPEWFTHGDGALALFARRPRARAQGKGGTALLFAAAQAYTGREGCRPFGGSSPCALLILYLRVCLART